MVHGQCNTMYRCTRPNICSNFSPVLHSKCMSPPVLRRHGSMWLFLFPKIQNTMKGKQFEVDAIKLNTTQQVLEILNTENEQCFH
jgi:hypothetical protein